MKAPKYDFTGAKKGEVELPMELFGAPIREDLMHLMLVRQNAHARQGNAHTKTRTEVRGGGRKPWRQKGTGRARQGSIRSPQWRGGGVVFGPRGNNNYSQNFSKKVRRAALKSALSLKAQESQVYTLTNWTEEAPKTKVAVQALEKIGAFRSVLVVIPGSQPVLQKSLRNIPHVTVLEAPYMNMRDLLKADAVMFYDGALEKAQDTFSSTR